MLHEVRYTPASGSQATLELDRYQFIPNVWHLATRGMVERLEGNPAYLGLKESGEMQERECQVESPLKTKGDK